MHIVWVAAKEEHVGATVKVMVPCKISVIVPQLGKLDLISAAGKMVLSMLVAVIEIRRDMLLARKQAEWVRAKSEGKTLGRSWETNAEQRVDIIAKLAPDDTPAHWRAYMRCRARTSWAWLIRPKRNS